MSQQKIPSENRAHLIEFISEGAIPDHHKDQAIVEAGVHPARNDWFNFLNTLFLILGSLSLSFSLLFFIAYNWQEFGRFAKFAMVEAAVISGTLVFITRSPKDLIAKVGLMGAAISLGVLMALFGQTYQTGADPWELFFNWALLLTPWVIIGRFPVLCILWIALLNLSLILYHQTFGSIIWTMSSEVELLWALFAFNLVAWIVWEYARSLFSWLDAIWSIRMIATFSGFCSTWLAIETIVGNDAPAGFLVWLIWCLGLLYLYQCVKRDLFILAGACLSAIVVATTFLIEEVMHFDSAGSFLFVSIAVIAMGSGSAMWLRHLHERWQNEQ